MEITNYFNALPMAEQRHSYRVAAISKLLAESMELSSPEVSAIEQAALFHDVGKVMVSWALHRIPGELSEKEREVVLSHTATGKKILESFKTFLSTGPIVAQQHHEFLDGSGYLGMEDKEIHPHAKLVTVVDVFDKLAFCRPGEDWENIEKACAVMLQLAESKLDARTVLILLANLGRVRETVKEATLKTYSAINTHC